MVERRDVADLQDGLQVRFDPSAYYLQSIDYYPVLEMDCGHFSQREDSYMAKAYWITLYREISDPAKLAAYASLGRPAIEAAGGRFLARGIPAQVYEAGLVERTVVVEFDSVEQAVAAHDSPAYQAALAALEGGAVRDLRIMAGV